MSTDTGRFWIWPECQKHEPGHALSRECFKAIPTLPRQDLLGPVDRFEH